MAYLASVIFPQRSSSSPHLEAARSMPVLRTALTAATSASVRAVDIKGTGLAETGVAPLMASVLSAAPERTLMAKVERLGVERWVSVEPCPARVKGNRQITQAPPNPPFMEALGPTGRIAAGHPGF